MKDQLTIHHLARRLGSGVKMINKEIYEEESFKLVGIKQPNTLILNGDWSGGTHHTYGDSQFSLDWWKPIYHPLADLTKPIRQANYNEGKEFVPIVELLKKKFPYDDYNSKYGEIDYKPSKVKFEAWYSYRANFSIELWSADLKSWPNWIYDLLLQWHFVIDEREGTWIDVNTLDKNPYL